MIDGQVVGLAWTTPSRDQPPVRERELVGPYLLATHHGTVLGQTLLDAALEDRPASLWMARDNARALPS